MVRPLSQYCPYISAKVVSTSTMSFTHNYTSASLMISPLLRQSFLLSSSTVFMFSIHMASTGPSNRNHFLFGVSLATPAQIKQARIPSVLSNNRDICFKMIHKLRRLHCTWTQAHYLKQCHILFTCNMIIVALLCVSLSRHQYGEES